MISNNIVVQLIAVALLFAGACRCECGAVDEDAASTRTTFYTVEDDETTRVGVEEWASCLPRQVTADYEVHIVSLEQSYGSSVPLGSTPDVVAPFTLTLEEGAGMTVRPVKLVLTSENPAQWNVVIPEGVVVEDIVAASEMASYGEVRVSGSGSTGAERIWRYDSDRYGYSFGFGSEEELVWAVEDWFGVITSYTGTEEAVAGTLVVGVESGEEELLDVTGSTDFGQMTCKDHFEDPFMRAVFTSRRARDNYGCYSGRVINGKEAHMLAINDAEMESGASYFSNGLIQVSIRQYNNEQLHPLRLAFASLSSVRWNITVQEGITIEDITLITSDMRFENVSTRVYRAGQEIQVPTNVVEESLQFEQTSYGSYEFAATWGIRQFGFLTSYHGVYQAMSYELYVGADHVHSDNADYEVPEEEPTTTTTQVTTTTTKATTTTQKAVQSVDTMSAEEQAAQDKLGPQTTEPFEGDSTQNIEAEVYHDRSQSVELLEATTAAAEEDHDRYFLLSLLPAFKRLEPRQNALAKIKFQLILYRLAFGTARSRK